MRALRRAVDAATRWRRPMPPARAGYVLGAELRACGVDFSFTPVLDLDHGGSGVIGDRAFHRDPRVVALLAKSLMHGLLQAGMANCGKHFPGHGFVKADSHIDDAGRPAQPARPSWPTTPRPTAGSARALASVMPAHVIYPKVDARPAGFSPRWLQGHPARPARLRRRDLQRRPEHGRRARSRRPRAELHRGRGRWRSNAGCDLVLLCNQSLGGGEAVDELLDGLAAAQRQRRLARQRGQRSAAARVAAGEPARCPGTS